MTGIEKATCRNYMPPELSCRLSQL